MKTNELIKKYRQDKNVSRKELANEIGCSVYAIEKYEQGQRTPSINTLIAISKALDVDSTNFLDKEERINYNMNEEKCKTYKIILKSGKEFEVNISGDKVIERLALAMNATEKIPDELAIQDEVFLIRLSEVAAIVNITEIQENEKRKANKLTKYKKERKQNGDK